MRVLLATLGSRGDVEPFLALAIALREAGHEPVLCASRRYAPWIASHGVDYQPMDDGFVELLESLEGRTGLERAAGPLGMLRTVWRLAPQIKPLQLQVQRDLWAAAQACQPQALVFHPKLAGAPDIAAALHIPSSLLLLVPMLEPTAAFACPVFPPWLAGLGRWTGHRAGYRLVRGLTRRFGAGPALAWRRELHWPGRPPGMDLLHDHDGQAIPVLHAHSPSLLPRPVDWPAQAQVTGFLRLPAQPDWQAPPDLLAFLQRGPAPVYIGFGSMAGRHPERRAREVLEALRLAGLRGVIGRGWGGLQPADLPDTVFALDTAPHDWLFPRMAAVVHHGGAGTTAAGLLAGRPSLICPFFGDQPFWGRLVHERGLGPAPVLQPQLNARRLAGALRELVDRAEFGRAAEALAKQMNAERGGQRAVEMLEQTWR